MSKTVLFFKKSISSQRTERVFVVKITLSVYHVPGVPQALSHIILLTIVQRDD